MTYDPVTGMQANHPNPDEVGKSGSLAYEAITVDLIPDAGETFVESEVFDLPPPDDLGMTVSIIGTADVVKFGRLGCSQFPYVRAFCSEAGFLPYTIAPAAAVIPVYRREPGSRGIAPARAATGSDFSLPSRPT